MKKRNDVIFYISLIFLPILQYLIFYIAVNYNSVVMSFQKFEVDENMVGRYSWLGFDNYKKAFKDIFAGGNDLMNTGLNLTMVKNSLIAFVVTVCVSTPLALIFSFYIVKKFKLHSFFRVVLFVPTIVAPVVLLNVYKIVCNGIIPEIFSKIYHFTSGDMQYLDYIVLENPDLIFGAVLAYSVFASFGTNVLLYTGAMSGVSPELCEAANLDGATDFKEFLHVHLPASWGTFTTFMMVSIAGIFTNQLGLFDLYSSFANARVQTIGYYLYINTLSGNTEGSYAAYPYLSAIGIIFTLIAAPVTFGVKVLLEKLGPRED